MRLKMKRWKQSFKREILRIVSENVSETFLTKRCS